MGEKLEILIEAKDSASNVFKSIGNAAGTALKTGLVAAAGAATAVGGALAYCIKESMESQKVQAQLAAVLKSTGGAAGVTAEMANDLANSLSGMTTFEDDAILAGENMLLTFTNIGKDVFPAATQAILDVSTATGQDLTSSAVQLGKALNDPVAGISALSRVGVTFTEDQKKMIEEMVKMGDVSGAQTIILQELQKEFGGSAEAAGKTFSGQLTILKNSMGNVAEEVGNALMPALQGFVTDSVLPFVQEYGPKLAEWMGENIPKAVAAASEFFKNELLPAITQVWNFASTVLIPFIVDTLYPWLKENIPKAIKIASDAWTTVLKPALETVWKFIKDDLYPRLLDIILWLKEHVPPAINKFKEEIWPKIKEAFEVARKFIAEELMPRLGDIVRWLGETISTAVTVFTTTIWPAIKKAFETVRDFIRDDLIPKFNEVVEFLKTGFNGAAELAKGAWNILLGAINAVKGAIQWIIENATRALELLGLVNNAQEENTENPGPTGSPNFVGGSNGGITASGTVINNWNLTIYAQEVVDPVVSFEMMKALAGA